MIVGTIIWWKGIKPKVSCLFILDNILDIGFIDNWEQYCPPLMEIIENDDNIKGDENRINRFL